MKFGNKLLLILVLIAIIPTAVLLFVSASLLTSSLDRWVAVGVRSCLEDSQKMARLSEEKSEKDALLFAQKIISSSGFGELTSSRNKDKMNQMLASKLEEYQLNFINIYNHQGELTYSSSADKQSAKGDLSKDELNSIEERNGFVFRGKEDDRFLIGAIIPFACPTRENKGEKGYLLAGYSLPLEYLSTKEKISYSLATQKTLELLKSSGKKLLWILALFLVTLFSILIFFISRYISRGISRPILALVEGTKRVGEGDLSYQLPATSKDEVGTLVRSFNQMSSQLKENKEKLLKAERIAAWREVARRLAHEIKNPLTPIQISLYRIKDKLVPEAFEDYQSIDESLKAISDQIAHLSDLASEFSLFAKLPEPKKVRCDMNLLLKQVLNLFNNYFEQIELETNFFSDLPEIKADPDQLRRAFINIIKNAIEATPPGGKVRVSTFLLSENQNQIIVAFEDSGCGIPEELTKKIFDPYFTTKTKGTGLGLAIMENIVKEHGGRIAVETQINKGTQLKIFLPIEDVDKKQTNI